MSIEIEVIRKARHLNAFLKLPWYIYKGDPNWVPPLLSDQKKILHPKINPFFQHAQMTRLVARSNGRVVGRICAIDDRAHVEYWEEPVGFFGFFECENDQEVANALLKAAADWLKPRGLDFMRGPVNPSTNDTCGLLIEGFDSPPVFMMPYNPPWYADLLEGTGLAKVKDLYAYRLHKDELPKKIIQAGEKFKASLNIRVRTIDLKNFDQELERVRQVYNQAWEKNWGFVPMTSAEFDHAADDMKKVLDPQLAFLAEDGDKPVGFSLGLPDYNVAFKHMNGRLFPFGIIKFLTYRKKIKGIRVLTMGVIKEYRKRGVDVVFYLETLKNAEAAGYEWGELSWVLEDNVAMNRVAKMIDAQVYKRYRIYEMAI